MLNFLDAISEEQKPKVTLLQSTDLATVVFAIRGCYASHESMASTIGSDYLSDNDKNLVKKIIESGHESTLEHCYYTFWIERITRGLLQELVRHRIASYSVQSTRYVLKKLVKNEEDHKKLFRTTGNDAIDDHIAKQLHSLYLFSECPNDMKKNMLPDAFYTNLTMTINARSLRNLLSLRLDPKAWDQARVLAHEMLVAIPREHREVLYGDLLLKYYGEDWKCYFEEEENKKVSTGIS
jgi:thymidylate synthase (FAD)